MTDNAPSSEQDDNSLDRIRELLIGRDEKYIQEKFDKDPKGFVSKVVSEALFEREAKDGSVNKVLVPLVEKSLHRSIEANSEKIVGTLYPLVGTLVRKAVSSFLLEFVERTNTLIENSLSPKSVSWRFKAWQSGIKYSEYVASQIYQYQVQQLLVIHRETGTLLHSISSDPDKEKDADLISSMLVAINDFVADAFGVTSNQTDNELDEIKTEDFTLLIAVGPQAILVAAVTGSVPARVKSKLQRALEEFHQFYQQPLINYDGDNAPFVGSETLLADCLLSERKDSEKNKSKRMFGGIVILLLLCGLGFLCAARLSLSILKSELHELTPPPGLLVTDTYISKGKVHAKVFRDPVAMSVSNWLNDNDINLNKLTIIEEPYLSLKTKVIEQKLSAVVNNTSLRDGESLNLEQNNEGKWEISGSLFTAHSNELLQRIRAIPGINLVFLDTSKITIIPSVQTETLALKKARLTKLANKISSQNVLFATNQETISEVQLTKLALLANDIKALQTLAQATKTDISIIIMGASDNTGSSVNNRELSQRRAQNVYDSMKSLGVDSDMLIPVSLGELPLQQPSMGRSVMLNVLISDSQ